MKRKEKQFWNLFNLFFVGLLLFVLTACSGLIPVTYTITATFEEGGRLEPAGEIEVNKGEDKFFNIIPDDGYQIAELLIDGLRIEPLSTYTFSKINQNHSVHVKFEEIEKPETTIPLLMKYYIDATTGEGGSIAPVGRIGILQGNKMVFTITPDDGYILSDVEVDGLSLGVIAVYTFKSVQENHAIHAEFVQKTYNLTLEANNSDWGTVADLTDSAPYIEGTEVNILAEAKEGYLFDHWESVPAVTFGDDNASDTTFTMPAQDVTVTAVFKEIVTIAGWDFEDGTKRNAVVNSGDISDYTPDLGDGVLSLVDATFGGQSAGEYFTQGSGGSGTYAAHSRHWSNGVNFKYWQIVVSTLDYKALKLSSKQRGSDTGPRDFIVQYSIDGSDWHDVPGATITVANNFTSAPGVLDGIDLPVQCEGQNSLHLRWVMSATTSVAGNNDVGGEGTNRIDDILLTGIAID